MPGLLSFDTFAFMVIAAAQTIAIKGDIDANICQHIKLIDKAVSDRADLIFFPELSLTGYEPELAQGLAMTIDDERLLVFKELAVLHHIIIAVGAPMRDESGTVIAMFIYMPDNTVQCYTKQYLHSGEELYFVPKYTSLQLLVKGKAINFAICADFSNPDHPKAAAATHADIYLASVLVSKNGLQHDAGLLRSYAEKYQMAVVMANYGGISGGYNCAGNTAVWSEKGVLQDYIMGDSEGMLVVDFD